MKRGTLALALAALLSLLCACALAVSPDEVTSWAQAEELIGMDGLWPAVTPSYAQKHGYQPVELAPEDALAALKRAYDGAQEAGYGAVLRGWGLTEAADDGEWIPYGRPERVTLGGNVNLAGTMADVEAIRFDGDWSSAVSLIFVREEYGSWQLIDCVRGDARALCVANDDGIDGIAFIECEEIGHGTGYYAELVQVYNPVTRQSEAAYTRTGYECPLEDQNMFLTADAHYDWDGLRVVVAAVFGGYAQEDGCRVFTQRAQMSEVYAYGYDANAHSLTLGAHGRCEGLSPAALSAVSVSEYLGGNVGFTY